MTRKDSVQVLVTLNLNYVRILGVMLYSLAYSNPGEHFVVWIMHPADEEWKLGRMRHFLPHVQRDQFEFREYPVSAKELSDAPVSERWPEVMYYRLISPWVIPDCPDRMLYLDPDIAVMNSVRPLWSMDLNGAWFAGASHVQNLSHTHMQDPMQMLNDIRLHTFGGTYLNSGVLLMDMKAIREKSSTDEVFGFIREHRARLLLPDQDVLNELYKDHLMTLDPFVYNLSDRILTTWNQNIFREKITDEWIRENTVFVHYCTRNKPWKKNYVGKLGIYWKQYEQMMAEE